MFAFTQNKSINYYYYSPTTYSSTVFQGLKFVSRGQDKWFPYDISCNLIRSADHARVHRDCESHEDEWTFLIYLTPNWTKNDYGETAFYESATDDTEIITEVRPRYGRAVIFQGDHGTKFYMTDKMSRSKLCIFCMTRLIFPYKWREYSQKSSKDSKNPNWQVSENWRKFCETRNRVFTSFYSVLRGMA